MERQKLTFLAGAGRIGSGQQRLETPGCQPHGAGAQALLAIKAETPQTSTQSHQACHGMFLVVAIGDTALPCAKRWRMASLRWRIPKTAAASYLRPWREWLGSWERHAASTLQEGKGAMERVQRRAMARLVRPDLDMSQQCSKALGQASHALQGSTPEPGANLWPFPACSQPSGPVQPGPGCSVGRVSSGQIGRVGAKPPRRCQLRTGTTWPGARAASRRQHGLRRIRSA